ncbi:translation initiation factor IF-2-like isoform X2 [Mya arenaria]|uniref:translation initiation factor IF-2-like isoform X2 n=1 Tax=Mya arenaria TaxID=6604 RepID=UPI0022E0516A|nr:translation initiation factor IF-2-like isoform X2 [Mya arenaria]
METYIKLCLSVLLCTVYVHGQDIRGFRRLFDLRRREMAMRRGMGFPFGNIRGIPPQVAARFELERRQRGDIPNGFGQQTSQGDMSNGFNPQTAQDFPNIPNIPQIPRIPNVPDTPTQGPTDGGQTTQQGAPSGPGQFPGPGPRPGQPFPFPQGRPGFSFPGFPGNAIFPAQSGGGAGIIRERRPEMMAGGGSFGGPMNFGPNGQPQFTSQDTTASNQNEQSTPQRFPNGQANFQNGQPNFPNGQPNFQNGQRQANFPNGQAQPNFPNGQAQTNFPNGQANFPQGFPNGQQPQFPMGFPPQRFPNGRQPFFPPGVPSRQPLPFPDRTQRSGQSEMAFGGPFPGGPFPFPPGGPGFQQTGFEDFRAQQSADLGPEFSTTSDQQQQNDISLNFQPLDQGPQLPFNTDQNPEFSGPSMNMNQQTGNSFDVSFTPTGRDSAAITRNVSEKSATSGGGDFRLVEVAGADNSVSMPMAFDTIQGPGLSAMTGLDMTGSMQPVLDLSLQPEPPTDTADMATATMDVMLNGDMSSSATAVDAQGGGPQMEVVVTPVEPVPVFTPPQADFSFFMGGSTAPEVMPPIDVPADNTVVMSGSSSTSGSIVTGDDTFDITGTGGAQPSMDAAGAAGSDGTIAMSGGNAASAANQPIVVETKPTDVVANDVTNDIAPPKTP